MIIAQCVLLTSLATIALVLPAPSTTLPTTTTRDTDGIAEPVTTHSTDWTTEPATTRDADGTTEPMTTHNTDGTTEPVITRDTTEFDGTTEPVTTCDTTETTDQLSTPTDSISTYADSSIATMAEPKVTHGDTNAPSSSSLSNGFELTSTWIIVTVVGGFTVLTAMPLVTIMILIVALGCVCKKYKRLKKQLFVPTEVVASSNYCTEMTTSTAKESDIVLTNIIFLDDNIDTDDNVAYGHMARVVERCDMADNMPTMQNVETDRARETRESSHNNLAMVKDNTVGNTDHDRMSTGVKDHDDNTISEDDAAEANGETDYVINDLYESIPT